MLVNVVPIIVTQGEGRRGGELEGKVIKFAWIAVTGLTFQHLSLDWVELGPKPVYHEYTSRDNSVFCVQYFSILL